MSLMLSALRSGVLSRSRSLSGRQIPPTRNIRGCFNSRTTTVLASSSSRSISTHPYRSFSTSTIKRNGPTQDLGGPDDIPIKSMSSAEYEHASDEDMDKMHENLEILCEEYLTGAEVEYSSGVMTLSTPAGTYVINKQPPNQQIWISSPFSGPARFGYSPDGVWVHHRRKDVTLGDLLDRELKELAGEQGADWEGTGLR